MTVRASLDCVLQRNTASYAPPTWVTVNNVKNVGIPKGKSMAEVTTRGDGGFKTFVGTLKEFGLEFEMNADDADADYTAFEDAYWTNSPLDLLVLRGPATAGTKGVRLQVLVETFDEQEDLEGNPVVSVKCVLAKTENPAAARYTVPGP